MYEEAEEWFIRSTHRLPNRIYPYYLLAKLYAEHPEVFLREKLDWAAVSAYPPNAVSIAKQCR